MYCRSTLIFVVPFLCVLQTQQHKFVNWQCDMEWRGEDFTAAVTLGNPDVLVGSGRIYLFVMPRNGGSFFVAPSAVYEIGVRHGENVMVVLFAIKRL